ncbi:adenosylcobinamide-phosphate synthase CbiB [Filomicrobium sp.]|uniref:adenosylcobinamide-phosphate synthase CbiB n=1 Tax=Filomicrobium sp. TaxID=2024831 RepID=UPI00258AF099|nr:adenosylcobinamide-phosphate synthase CbiB [Filomicrobium sp.]MCV0368102.1 adenosylcobinamide-phosphate synthase CbiB [Filomicrobium sp.]
MYAPLTLIALLFEAACGYPQRLYRALGHPVSWIGRLITWCESAWNGTQYSFEQRRFNGLMALVVCLSATLIASLACVLIADRLLPHPLNVVIVGIVASAFIAQRSLYQHVEAVADALESEGIESGRRAVAMIVGRDPTSLDEHAVSRAAIESLSENFSDGIVAPTFWLLISGLPGVAAYKTINTADSMIGHKSDRYLAFGWAAARLDDIVNLPASRLSGLLIAAAAFLLPQMNGRDALQAIARDAGQHRSPNAGWPEAAMAGALGLKLAGPRIYDGLTVPDHWMGQGRAEANAVDIRRALQVYRIACVIQAVAIAVLAIAMNVWI